MSRIITNTNIIVDDFDFCKSFPKNTFIHFLTHFHADHYEGLSPLWNYGDIHCTHQTKQFLINKFPKLQTKTRICSYDLNTKYQVEVGRNNWGQRFKVQFYLFDAKHIPGSAMILFKGFMGSILFTGDFRYNYSMLKQNPILFPQKLRSGQNEQKSIQKMAAISVHVDQMIFDNTYCNQFFQFETEPFIAQKMVAIIKKNLHKKLILIAMGALGKHKILVEIAQQFKTLIVVSQSQLNKITVAKLNTQYFTTDKQNGFIHLVSKKKRGQTVQVLKVQIGQSNFICIDTDFLMLNHQAPDGINYIVPYSLHSNYKQMQTFIRMVQPSILRKLVTPYSNFKHVKLAMTIDHRIKFSKYLEFLENGVQKSDSGYSYLVKFHTDITTLSDQYLQWFDPKNYERLEKILNVGQQNHDLRKRQVKLISQQELLILQSIPSGKESLQKIAGTLNATHKNMTLEKSMFSNPIFSQKSRQEDVLFYPQEQNFVNIKKEVNEDQQTRCENFSQISKQQNKR